MISRESACDTTLIVCDTIIITCDNHLQEILNDWGHIAWKIKRQRAKLIEDDDARKYFKESLEVLHLCRTEDQFNQVGRWVADGMTDFGLDEFMATFASEYLVKQWCVACFT